MTALPPTRVHTNDLVIVCASVPYDGHTLAEQNLVRQLAGRFTVLYVDPPLGLGGVVRDPTRWAALRTMPLLREEAPDIVRLKSVVVPAKDRAAMTGVTTQILRRRIRTAISSLGGAVRAVVVVSPQRPMLGLLDAGCSVYWAKDDYAAAADLIRIPQRRLERGMQLLVERADLVVAASPYLAETLRQRGAANPLVIPNGCDVDMFARAQDAVPPPDVCLPRPILGFVGQLSERIDWRLLDTVAATGRSVLLIGGRQKSFDDGAARAVLDRPNVQWTGGRPFSDLPAYMSVMDVGLLPYTNSEFNRASFPLKLLEYMAAGLPVVATDLPAVRWLATDLIASANTGVDYVAAVERFVHQVGTPVAVEQAARRRSFARAHSWQHRADAWVHALEDC